MAMRMGPFSQPAVIQYINQQFVPIFISNEDYLAGKQGDQETELLAEIRRTTRVKGLRDGAVYVYLLKPDGDVIDVMHVAKAMQLDQLMPWLRKVSTEFGTVPGVTLVPPSTSLNQPTVARDEMALHLRAQYLDRASDPVDDWVVLKRDEWSQFVTSPASPTETEWQLDPQLAKKVLLPFYPYSADWTPDLKSIKSAEMQLRLIKEESDVRTLAIEGSIQRVQNRQPGRLPLDLRLEVIGLAKVRGKALPEVTLTTFHAQFGQHPFEGIMQSWAKKEDAEQ